MTQSTPTYHFADGFVLTIGNEDASLVNVDTNEQIEVDEQYLYAAERVALGWSPDAHLDLVEEMVEEGVLLEGPMTRDEVLHAKLTALDAMYAPIVAPQRDASVASAYELCATAHAYRKRFQVAVGQCAVLPEAALRRALLVGDAARVGKKRVLCIGDDDLVSVALAALGHEVTVFDIDDYLLDLLRAMKDLLGLPIELAQVDLRDPVMDTERAKYDVFLTDPMSNRDCFEVFLSRGLALLKEDGEGYVAVYAPASRLFQQVADEMRLGIRAWHRRFNRYYSPFMKVHWYESDWVKVAPTPETRPAYAPSELCTPLNFYREDYYLRSPALLSLFDGIEEPRLATPMFLDMLMSVLDDQSELLMTQREIHIEDDWTLIRAALSDGHLTLHVDRARRQILVEMYPFVPDIADALRNLILAGYKSRVERMSAHAVRGVWDLRFI